MSAPSSLPSNTLPSPASAASDELKESLERDDAAAFVAVGRRLRLNERHWMLDDGGSALIWAINHQALHCVRALLDTGELFFENPESVFHTVAGTRCGPGIADLFLSRFDPSRLDPFGQNALHHAARLGSSTLLERLLADGRADISARNGAGETPIMTAAVGRHLDCALVLAAQSEAGIWLRDKEGRCLMDFAIEAGHAALICVLAANADSSICADERQERLSRAFRSLLASQAWETADAICGQLSHESLESSVAQARGGWLDRLLRRRSLPMEQMPNVVRRLTAIEEHRQIKSVLALANARQTGDATRSRELRASGDLPQQALAAPHKKPNSRRL
jgi:hypothetical protein